MDNVVETRQSADLSARKRLAEFLQKKTIELEYTTGKIWDQKDVAEWLGVPNTSFNQWWNAIRLPRGINVDLLAEKFGIEIYDVLGVPERLPPDPKLIAIVKAYYAANQEGRDRIVREAEKSLEGSKSPETTQGALAYVTQ